MDVSSQSPDIQTVYVVYQGDDEHHPGTPRWYFSTRALAEQNAKYRGWRGADAPIREKKMIVCNGNCYLLFDEAPILLDQGPEDEAEARRRALAKLTDEEKKLLGLDTSE